MIRGSWPVAPEGWVGGEGRWRIGCRSPRWGRRVDPGRFGRSLRTWELAAEAVGMVEEGPLEHLLASLEDLLGGA